MNKLTANSLRFVLCALGCGLALWYCYHWRDAQTPVDRDIVKSYVVTCGVLGTFGLIGWLLRSRRSRVIGFISSALIAAGISLGFIWLTGAYGASAPWTYFYQDDYIFAFMYIAPISLATLTGLLSLIPEQYRVPHP